MGIFLLTFLCVNNAFRARARRLKVGKWVLYTILAALAGMLLASMVIIIVWIREYGSSPEQMDMLQEMIKSGELQPNSWNEWLILAGEFGGYLFIRYRIDKHPLPKDDGQDNLPT